MFRDCSSLSSVSFKADCYLSNSVNMKGMFENFRNLTDLILPRMHEIGDVTDIFRGCISIGAAPKGGQLPIIKDDVRETINIIEKTIYPKMRLQKPQKISDRYEYAFHLGYGYYETIWRPIFNLNEIIHTNMKICDSFKTSVPEDVE